MRSCFDPHLLAFSKYARLRILRKQVLGVLHWTWTGPQNKCCFSVEVLVIMEDVSIEMGEDNFNKTPSPSPLLPTSLESETHLLQLFLGITGSIIHCILLYSYGLKKRWHIYEK